jgi:predicted metal-binding membrane protein
MGAALGAATGHMGVWIAAGIAVYIAITFIGGMSGRDKSRAKNTK